MSTATRPVNPMTAEGKAVVMETLRRDRRKFFDYVEDPALWNLQTRCTDWEVRDLAGHMIDVIEGYFERFDAARAGKDATALGLQVMGETLNDHALEFRSLPREEVLDRLRRDAEKMVQILEDLTPEEWTGMMVTHPYMGPVPAGFYASFQIMDYGIHPYDVEYGMGNKLATIDEVTAGILIPYCHIIMQYTVEAESARGLECTYGIDVSGDWGGRWRVTVKDGQWSAAPESGEFEGCDALFRYTPDDFVLTTFGRFPGGSATGDPEVIERVRRLFFRF